MGGEAATPSSPANNGQARAAERPAATLPGTPLPGTTLPGAPLPGATLAEKPSTPSMISFDLPIMVAVAVACLPVFFNGACISRGEGALFLALYLAYTLYLFLLAAHHDALNGYSMVMGGFVLPLVAVVIVVPAWRHWNRERARSDL